MKTLFTILGFVALIVLVVVVGPLLTLWAWNTLFPSVAIDYNLHTWFAVVILGAFFRANVSIKKNS